MIKLYAKNNCNPCKMTKRWLDEHNVEYEEINIDENEQAREYLQSINVRSAPHIESNIGDWQGFRPEMLKELI